RLAHDEAFALSLDVAARRRRATGARGAGLPIDAALHARLVARLPHAPTAAQARVLEELRDDLLAANGRPMSRLLQGDVGSGKTLLAFYAMLAAVECGRQAALMAPTEILAAQHLRGLRALLARAYGERAPRVAFVGAATSAAERAALRGGEAALAVGTHALQAAGLRFRDLALTVVDEQHRFGVLQRSRFRAKGRDSHLLVMTATPIPRTLALTAYGELDVSVLDELPPGRAPRATELIEHERQRALWAELRAAVARGERGYVVCPSIGAARGAAAGAARPVGARPASRSDEDDEEAGHSVAATLVRMRRALGAGVRVGAVHGRMPPLERDAVLEAFRSGALDVLVATVLVEVGLDVPEATFVVLPDASRFGLAQMHQIRGRVGRGGRPGRCLLLLPLPPGPARARAEALVATDDGFRLAEQDLALRGPGELLGTAQSGLPDFAALDPVRDVELLATTRPLAFAAAEGLSNEALAAMRARVFPVMELRAENLLAGG
ncbi:MAG TPA: DEAD/DEAH box helicase, partial [Planctomycetota bacterium]|nr:DEAD/DEAH box helicase [Planctomycetota bacterium]